MKIINSKKAIKNNKPRLIIGQKRMNKYLKRAYYLGYMDGLTFHKEKGVNKQ